MVRVVLEHVSSRYFEGFPSLTVSKHVLLLEPKLNEEELFSYFIANHY